MRKKISFNRWLVYGYGSLISQKLESQEFDNSLRLPNHFLQVPIQNLDFKSPWVYNDSDKKIDSLS